MRSPIPSRDTWVVFPLGEQAWLGTDAVVAGPVVALAGDRDPHVGLDEVEAWRGHTTGAFELKVFPGGHFFLTDHEPEIAALVTDTLHATLRPGPVAG